MKVLNATLLGILATLLLSSGLAQAQADIQFGRRTVFSGESQIKFARLLDQALTKTAVEQGFADLLQDLKFTVSKVEMNEWDKEYKIDMKLSGRNRNMYDDGVLAVIQISLNYEPGLEDLRITRIEVSRRR